MNKNRMSGKFLEIDYFSREQTEILKGIGILLIVLHNIFHNMTPIIGQNEFTYHFSILSNLLQTLRDAPQDILRALFSYFGHYGVQIFVFFSAYGLTRKYRHKPIGFGNFLKNRIDKVYLSFLICIAVYIVLGLLKSEFLTTEKVLYWDSLLWKVLLVSSFIPGQSIMPVGPWWFIPFVFQFYLLYPILIRFFRRYGAGFLVILSVGAILTEISVNPLLIKMGVNLNFMVFGHLPVLCLGIYFAIKNQIRLRYDIVLISTILFVIGNMNAYVWTTTDVTFTIVVLAIAMLRFNLTSKPSIFTGLLLFFGGISLHLFMVNGFLRSPFHNYAELHNNWWVDNLAAFASLLFSTLFAIVLGKIDIGLRSWIGHRVRAT